MSELMHNLGYGAIVAVIGMLVVFLGLIIIIAMINIISYFLRKLSGEGKTEKKEEAPAPAAVSAPAPAPAQMVPVYEEVTDNKELIAVIAAALAAFEGGSQRLVVRSVRRVAGWQNAVRNEQIYKF